MDTRQSRLDELALPHASNAFAELRPDYTVEQALASVRSQSLDSAIVYFYVVDDSRRLRGVVPTRRLLTSDLGVPISSVMNDASVTLPPAASLRDAAALLVRHRLLAAPIVDADGRMLGVIDAAALGIDVAAELNGQRVAELFQLIGVRVMDTASGSFAARFPSLLWNVTGGLIAAVIAGANEDLLRTFTALALFMPVTLALSESIGIQSVVLTIERGPQRLVESDWRVALRSLARQGGSALLLAAACASLVSVVALAWQRDMRLTAVVALAIPAAMVVTAVAGLLIPRVLHALRRNPSVAAGPMVLAIADFISLLVYFRVAHTLLR